MRSSNLLPVGCEARKTPADAGVFFLDFYFYRTYQDLATVLGVEIRSAIIKNLDHRVLPNSQGKVGEDDGQAIEKRFSFNQCFGR
jgi:hypothetical protein